MTKKNSDVKENESIKQEEKVEEVKNAVDEELQNDDTEKKEKKSKKSSDKNSELIKKIEELENEKAELKDSMLRRAAEFENYKRRTEKEQTELIKFASERFILSILPVFNDLERSISHIDDENNTEALKKGLNLVFTNFKKAFDEHDVKKIEAKGNPFDFNLHEALMQQPADNVPAHTVLEEIEPGFTYKGKVIKHAKVIVSQEIIKPEPEEDKKEETKEEEK